MAIKDRRNARCPSTVARNCCRADSVMLRTRPQKSSSKDETINCALNWLNCTVCRLSARAGSRDDSGD
ncbi:hypothetical protein D3C72_2152700 [compost metagenome]